MPDYKVVVNDCFAPPYPGLTLIRTRPTPHGDRTHQYEYDRLAQGLPHVLTDRQLDWADVLGSIFAIDLTCERGPDADWSRTIEAWIPVRDVALWQPLAPRLEHVFGALTYDRLTLHFFADPSPSPASRTHRIQFPGVDGVALLSGGVDSFVGAASLLDSGHRPLLMSHKNSSAASTAITAVTGALLTRGAPLEPIAFTARRTSGALGGTENTMRARSLLYMGLAALVATAMGTSRVWINENGVMAIHVPMTEARAGSLSTRTASPIIIADIADLASLALGAPVTIDNELVGMTKPEVVQLGAQVGVATELAQTVSCWSVGRTHAHCGRCAPCLIRAISFEWADVIDAGYDSQPMDAVPSAESWSGTAEDNLSHLLQLAVDLTTLTDDDLELDYPETLEGTAVLGRRACLAMHRRWGEQCLDVAKRHPHSRQMLDGP